MTLIHCLLLQVVIVAKRSLQTDDAEHGILASLCESMLISE